MAEVDSSSKFEVEKIGTKFVKVVRDIVLKAVCCDPKTCFTYKPTAIGAYLISNITSTAKLVACKDRSGHRFDRRQLVNTHVGNSIQSVHHLDIKHNGHRCRI